MSVVKKVFDYTFLLAGFFFLWFLLQFTIGVIPYLVLDSELGYPAGAMVSYLLFAIVLFIFRKGILKRRWLLYLSSILSILLFIASHIDFIK